MAQRDSNPPPQPSSNSSVPMPLHTADSQKTPSVISSRMTDIASEDGDGYHPDGAVATGRPAVGLLTGRTLNDPVRPQSAMSSQTRPSTCSPPSRRGVPFSGGLRFGGAFGGSGGTISNTSRPPSATSRTSRTSRTHVPSLASHAFFRPMSSQRLQAQRGGRPAHPDQSISSVDGYSDGGSNANRLSLGSNATVQQGLSVHYDDKEKAPPSRGTEFSDPDERGTVTASPIGDTTVQSIGESERPLKDISLNVGPTEPNYNNDRKQPTGSYQSTEKPPRSFRANFLVSTSANAPTMNNHQEQGRFSSANAFPRSVQMTTPKNRASQGGMNYQYFSGNTIFYCGGRLQNTRDRPINIATGIIVILPSILFFVYSAPWLWHNVSPTIPIIFAYLFFICISSFIHASVTDPGIIPRNLHPFPPPDASEDPLTLGPPTTDWTMIKSAGKESTAMDVPTKYCKTCNVWRPPRCHHCRVCNNCIETQDHHCIWLNNCVGRRNYRYFFSFVSTGTLLGIFITFGSLGHCLRYQSTQGITFAQSIDKLRVPFSMMIYGLLATPYPASLWGYHLYLTGRGETTREYLNSHKFPKKDRHRPFTQRGILKNWLVVLLRPRTPTYLHFKQKYEDGDQRFGRRRGRKEQPFEQGDVMEMRDVSNTFQGPMTVQA